MDYKGSGTIIKDAIHLMEIPGEEREKEAKELFKVIMTEKFSKLISDTTQQIHIQEGQITQNNKWQKTHI